MKNPDFDNLIDLYLKGRVSPYEREKIDSWMEVMKTVDSGKKVLTYEDESELFKRITSETSTIVDVISFEPTAWKRPNLVSNSGFRVAAGIILLLGLLILFWIFFR